MSDHALDIKDVRCAFQRWGQTVLALDEVNLSVSDGEWLALAGHNGAGKSTLLGIIAGELRDFSGQVRIGGRVLVEMSERERRNAVYYVHQDPALGSAPLLTIYENLLVADPDCQGCSRQTLEARYNGILAEAGLEARLHHPASHLSGGERQLLAFLIARLRPSKIVLLDEPLAALDASRTTICLRLIAALQEAGKTLLFVTHSLRLAATLGDRTVLLSNGRIIYDVHGDGRRQQDMRMLMDKSVRDGVD